MTEQVQADQVVGVRFQKLGKLYHFDTGGVEGLRVGDHVIVRTSRGRELAQIASMGYGSDIDRNRKLKKIQRLATPRELIQRNYWSRKELEAMIECRAQAAEQSLAGVKIVKAEYSYDGSRLTYLFNTDSDESVDLKPLRREMQRIYKRTRIEFRQIGPRDVAKVIGGMGACGLEERCCSKFLTEFSPISIRMAKAQGISLNPNEITGMCGRLRCCLVYEYEQYVEARKQLPKVKKKVVTPMGEGKVVDVLPLKQAVVVLFEDGKRAEFLKHELEPYDELKALQAKANGPCDRHENGGCDCGRSEQ